MKPYCNAALVLLATASLPGLGACSQDTTEPAQETATAPAAATDRVTPAAGLTISNARIVLAAVQGNPAAVYFDLSYAGSAPVTLDDVEVDGAGMAMIHKMSETNGVMSMTDAGVITLAEGQQISFAPGGLHVMAMEPTAALKAGGTAKVTLTLSDGTTVTIDAPVRAAGEER